MFSKLIFEYVVTWSWLCCCCCSVHLWEIGEFCLTFNNEVIMSNLGAIASMFQKQSWCLVLPSTSPVSLLNLTSLIFT